MAVGWTWPRICDATSQAISEMSPLRSPGVDQDEPPHLGRTREAPATSIAVLPFSDMSPQQDQDYFCEGMTEELIHRLTRVRSLRVASRMSVLRYKESPRYPGNWPTTPRAGRTRRRRSEIRNRLRITAELTSVAEGCQLWSESYDRAMKDVFAIQDEIAHNIVRSMELALSAGERRFSRNRRPPPMCKLTITICGVGSSSISIAAGASNWPFKCTRWRSRTTHNTPQPMRESRTATAFSFSTAASVERIWSRRMKPAGKPSSWLLIRRKPTPRG